MVSEHEAYCQPCVSPVWDTALTCHALLEAGGEAVGPAKQGAGLADAETGVEREGRLGGETSRRAAGRLGVPVQQRLLSRSRRHRRRGDGDGSRAARQDSAATYDAAIDRGREWIDGLQSSDGGFAAFDADNLEYYLNNIPFSDHGALLDPPTEDVTARCVSMLAQLGQTVRDSPAVAAGVDYLRRTQLAEGSWYGRWGLNYIYGTWSVLCALNAAGIAHRRSGDAQGGGLADFDPEQRWRLGRGCQKLQLDYKGYQRAPTTRLANGMGLAWTDGGGRGRSIRRSRAAWST